MLLHWTERNLGKIKAHGLDSNDVESAFDSPNWAIAPSDLAFRWVGEGSTYNGRLIRVIYAETEDGPYVITAFPIRTQQRRAK
jgi:uncharacterized DUF497 family protein